MTSFAEYVESVSDPSDREALRRAWEVATAAAPEAVEGTSYGLPALKVGSSPLFAVKASAKHLTMFPFSSQVLEALSDRLDGLASSKGSVQFSAAHPVPADVVEAMVRSRRAEISGGS